MRAREQAAIIKGIFYTHCKDIIDGKPRFDIIEIKKRNDDGTISSDIRFIDGSVLNFIEKLVDGKVELYSYEYLRPDTGFFFHYHNEGIEDGIRKPLHHLHVGIKKDADKKLLDIMPEELMSMVGLITWLPKWNLLIL